jgi:glucokinase
MNSPGIGIDIGGSAIKMGLVAPDGRVLARHRIVSGELPHFPDLVAALCRGIKVLWAGQGMGQGPIGIAVPGYPDPVDGRLVDGAHNIPILRCESLPLALAATGLPRAVMMNDGIAAALGEYHFGAGRGFARFALLTIGTGIGGAVVIDGKAMAGDRGEPPELGGLVLDAEGPCHVSGLRGTLEKFAASPAFGAAYAARGGTDDCGTAALFARAAAGDTIAVAAIDAVCRRLAQGAGMLINALCLQACLLGGGVSAAGPALLDRVQAHLPDFTWPLLLARSRLCLAATGNDAGLLGAAAKALGLDR